MLAQAGMIGKSQLRPGKGRKKKSVLTSLMLTSLVDAFSILVIFLIMNHATNQENLPIGEKIQLPESVQSQMIQNGVVVRIENGGIWVEDKPVSLSDLTLHLKNLHARPESQQGLIVVADKKMDYADLNPVILAGSAAGYTQFKFAVVTK
ncbi:MAG: ExbD/TolR family protein [Bdellovibrionales bacterium]